MTKKTIDPDAQEQSVDTAQRQVEGLVTVETQVEQDAFSGRRTTRTFLKMYVAARTSGLLAAISDRDWKTLCVLATYMDADGWCYPSQAELARALGCSRQMANARVNSLARFRFQGKPVLLIRKKRGEQGTWAKNDYQVRPIAKLRIFDDQDDDQDDGTAATDDEARRTKGTHTTVSSTLDTVAPEAPTVSSQTVTVQLDTNKNQRPNQNQINNSKIRKGAIEKKRNEDAESTPPPGDAPDASGSHWELPAPSGSDPTSAAAAEPAPPASGLESIAETLQRRQRRPQRYDTDRQRILAYLQDFSRELGDQAPLTSSVTRAYRLYQASGQPIETFVEAMYQARAITKERSGSIRSQSGAGSWARSPKNKAAYFFAVLEDLLGLKDPRDIGDIPQKPPE